MEEVLEALFREASPSKHQHLRVACTQAKDVLESQAGLLRSPPYQLRALCLSALQGALESRQSKLVSLAVSGYFKMLRDTQFHSGYEEDDESTWLAAQVLATLHSLHLQPEDTQVDLLKVVLNMSCVAGVSLSGQLVTQVVGVCGLAYGRGGAALRTAAQAAASQAIARLVRQLKEESEEQEKLYHNRSPVKKKEEEEEEEKRKKEEEEEEEEECEFIAPAFDESVPVINFIADKLMEAKRHEDDKKGPEIPALYLLECTKTLLTCLSQPQTLIHLHKPSEATSLASSAGPPGYCSTLLTGALWQRLCPALVALLGTPVSQRLARASGRAEGQMGRGSGCMAHPGPLFNNQQARAIYSVVCGLVVTMGGVGEMRPVLESLLHRMLLYPPPQCRQDALKAITELLGNPMKLVQLAGPILYPDPRNPHQNDMALFRLVMDSLGECARCSEPGVQRVLVGAVSALLASLEQLTLGGSLSKHHVGLTNALYARLEDGDYSGPLTYENKTKLPKYEAQEGPRTPHDPPSSRKTQRLHTAHLLSLHVMMSSGLELGSHSPDCWTHIFRCCVYLAELEHTFFTHNSGYQSFPTRLAPPPHTSSSPSSSLQLGAKVDSTDDMFSDDYSRYMVSACPLSPPPSTSVEELIRESQRDTSSNSCGFLSTQDTGKAICALTQLVDRLFDDASTKLNMSSLVSFLTELCAASQAQLFMRMAPQTPQRSLINWARKGVRGVGSSGGGGGGGVGGGRGGWDVLLLHRLAEVMLRAVGSGRPLLHVMRAWAVAGPHFMEAACHKDASVSKKAVSSIHDIVNALLNTQSELPHFHFNEALFKPFENLLCLELCDTDVQEQIISSICEFVESCTPEIRSGWRPLFGALRCVRAPSPLKARHPSGPVPASAREGLGHLRVVRDVFEAFLTTDNVLVFANAALDCILCLLKHLRGTDSDREEEDDTEDGGRGEKVVGWEELVGGGEDLCLDALRYLHRCAAILASMYEMPACPVFHAAHRITVNTPPQLVDPHLPGVDETLLWSLVDEIAGTETEKVSYKALWPSLDYVSGVSLAALDHTSGILQVWYLLLEGLAGATMTCPHRYQPQALDTLFSLFRSLPDCPGPTFGMYCVNHLLLPLMQSWLRRSTTQLSSSSQWEFSASFKQYTGLTSDLVVDYITKLADKGMLGESRGALLMLQECLLVLVECVAHPSEATSRLGCACLRHVVTSCGDRLPPRYWDVVVCALHRASQVALYPLYQLMTLFQPDSPNFYGDIGQVKVAARRDCTGKDSDRLRQLSHQVFLLDTQRTISNATESNPDAEDRSFIFLLYPEDRHHYHSPQSHPPPPQRIGGAPGEMGGEGEPLRVPFRTLVVGLLSHQILLQTLGTLLVRGSPHIIPSLANVLLQGGDFSSRRSSSNNTTNNTNNTSGGFSDSGDGRVAESEGRVPGMLRHMDPEHIHILLAALHLSYTAAIEFDRRPGLKFLIQKVAQAERAANLYRQAGASWTLRMVTLFDLTLSQVKNGLGLTEVKEVLERDVRVKNTVLHGEEEEEEEAKKKKEEEEEELQKLGQTQNTKTAQCHSNLSANQGHIESHTRPDNRLVNHSQPENPKATESKRERERQGNQTDNQALKNNQNRNSTATKTTKTTECHKTQGKNGTTVEDQKSANAYHNQNRNSTATETKRNTDCREGQTEGHTATEGQNQVPRPTSLLAKNTTQYIQQLRASFTQLCDVYLDLVIDRDGHYSAMDRMDDKPIFFLTVQPDEFPTAHRQALDEWARTLEESTAHLAKGRRMRDDEEDENETTENEGSRRRRVDGCKDSSTHIRPSEALEVDDRHMDEQEEEEEEVEVDERGVKPFSFSDLAREYSSDSDDSEVPEYADGNDSGVASLAGTQQSVYKVATERDIATLVTDYRRRKNQHSLPSLYRGGHQRANPFLERRPPRPADPVPPEIEEQRSTSLMKDSEAHLKVWTEMVVTVFDLISQLSDGELRPLLPLLFPTMRSLTAHAHDPHLRQVVAELLTRVATLYGFSPAE